MAQLPAFTINYLPATEGLLTQAHAHRLLTRGFTRQWNDANVRAHLLVTGSTALGGEAVLAQTAPGRGSALELGQDDRNQGFVLSVKPWEQSGEAITNAVATIEARQASGRLRNVTAAVQFDLIWLDQQVMLRLGNGANPPCDAYQVSLDLTSNQNTTATVHFPDITFVAAETRAAAHRAARDATPRPGVVSVPLGAREVAQPFSLTLDLGDDELVTTLRWDVVARITPGGSVRATVGRGGTPVVDDQGVITFLLGDGASVRDRVPYVAVFDVVTSTGRAFTAESLPIIGQGGAPGARPS